MPRCILLLGAPASSLVFRRQDGETGFNKHRRAEGNEQAEQCGVSQCLVTPSNTAVAKVVGVPK